MANRTVLASMTGRLLWKAAAPKADGAPVQAANASCLSVRTSTG